MTDKIDPVAKAVDEYLELIEGLTPEQHEVFFDNTGRAFPIVTDRDKLLEFARSNDQIVGLASRNPYWIMLHDVVEGPNGPFMYMRVVPADLKTESLGVVIVAELDGKFLITENNRHATGKSHWEFPRGFADKAIAGARNELKEEGGVEITEQELTELGITHTDTGLTSASVTIVHAQATRDGDATPESTEAITGKKWVTKEELRRMIAEGEITDNFTLAAVAQLTSKDVSAFSQGSPGAVDLTGRQVLRSSQAFMSVSSRNPFSNTMPSQQRGQSLPAFRI